MIVGQTSDDTGYLAIWNGVRYLIESGFGVRFGRCMFDGFRVRFGCVREQQNQTAFDLFNIDEINQFPIQEETVIIPRINKPCWVGWFEFTNSLSYIPPANCLLSVPDDGVIRDATTVQFAQWIQGDDVDQIERDCLSNPLPCVAYWDAREWPKYPNLKSTDWLGLQAYCRVSETPNQFEFTMRNLISQIPNPKIALVCQCYTSNIGLTTDLIELVPVYARLARDFPKIDFLLVFSDQGRLTGLNDHPEVKQYWQQLYDGVTGEPDMPDEDILPEDIYNTLVRLRPKYPTPLEPFGAALLNETAWIHRDQGWKLHLKEAGRNCPQPETGIRCSCDFLRLGNFGYDALVDSENIGTPVRGARQDVTEAAVVEPVNPNNFPGIGFVDILYYDQVVRRSDPNGMLIRFDVPNAQSAILEFQLDLLDDGEPSIQINFLDEPRRDGRYCRALAFKPTVNGEWTLLVTARDNQNRLYESNRTQRVTVTF